MASLREGLKRVFSLLAGLFWLTTFCALVWQIWFAASAGAWEMLSVKTAYERALGGLPVFTSDSAQVIFAIVSQMSLVVAFGVVALAASALAKIFD
jgi:hypothetical protein